MPDDNSLSSAAGETVRVRGYWLRAVCLSVAFVAISPAWAEDAPDPHLPQIVDVVAPLRLAVGSQGEIRIRYRAAHANVVAVVRSIEDLDGSLFSRATSEREFGVVARAFGFQSGELTVPLSFTTPGTKRITLTLVTDGRERSEPAILEVEAW